MRLVILDTSDKVAEWSAKYVLKRINDFKPSPDRYFVLGLPTGGTPLGMYKKLIEYHNAGRVSFKYVKTFNMDEYVELPRDHPESYHYYMWNNFFKHIDIDPKNAHILDGNAPDLVKECDDFERKIKEAGGVELFVGGIGPDGHIAFNEPGSSLVSRTRVKTLAQDTLEANARFFGNDIQKVPKQALTVGVGTVMDAKEVMILITGTHKSFALYKAIEEGVNHMWTVSAFQQHEHTLMICDEDATLELRVKTVKYFKNLWKVHNQLVDTYVVSDRKMTSVDLPTHLSKELLDTLLRHHFGPTTNVQSFTVQALTQPGDNYGSTLIIVDANLQQDEQNASKTFSLVAKFFPTVPILCTLINITETFSKEVDLYKLVLPEFKSIQVENGVPESKALDIFPLYYGSRLSLSENAMFADGDAVLLLENLKAVGYRVGDRLLGLDLEHTEIVMSQLARFHALSIALKIKKPEVFKNTVRKAGVSCKWGPAQDYESLNKWKNTAINALQSIPECVEHVSKVKDFLMNEEKIEAINSMPPKEPFATYIHNDFWISNIMFCYNGCALAGVKFLDFQLTQYHSPIKDIIVFLYTSTAENVRDKHYDHLIKLYHNSFIKCLQQLKCDTSMFSIEQLIEEFDTFAITEFSRLLLALKVFCVEEKNVPDLANFSLDKLLEGSVGGKLYERRMKELVLDFINKGWL